jgi:hypothetical protein
LNAYIKGYRNEQITIHHKCSVPEYLKSILSYTKWKERQQVISKDDEVSHFREVWWLNLMVYDGHNSDHTNYATTRTSRTYVSYRYSHTACESMVHSWLTYGSLAG